jgi:outer membrane protein TolC
VAGSTPGVEWSTYVEMVASGNPRLREVAQGFADAQGRAIQLRAVAYPTADALALALPPTFYFRIEQVLVDRAVGPQFELARLAPRLAQARFEAALEDTVFTARQSFAAALAAGQRVRILEDHAPRAAELARQSAALFEAGRAQRADVARLEVRANLLAQKLAEARTSHQSALAELAALAGRPGPRRPRGPRGEDPPPPLDAPALIQEALQNRADLEFLRREQLVSGQNLLLATRPLYPRLALFTNPVFQPANVGSDFDIGRNDNEPTLIRREETSQLPAGVRLTWTLLDGGASAGQKRSAQAELLSQKEALAALESALPGEIAHALATLRAAHGNLERAVLAPSPAQLRQAAESDYTAGRLSLADRVRAEDTVLAQEMALLSARLACSLASSALDAARGRVVRLVTTP